MRRKGDRAVSLPSRRPVAPAERVGQRAALRHELERDGVDAVAQAGRGRTVGEDVTLMAAAAGADGLGPGHAVRPVDDRRDVVLADRLGKAGPARAALELGAGAEQGQAALAAGVDAGSLLAQQDAAERGLGAVGEQDAPFLGAEVGLQRDPLALGRRGQVEAGGGTVGGMGDGHGADVGAGGIGSKSMAGSLRRLVSGSKRMTAPDP